MQLVKIFLMADTFNFMYPWILTFRIRIYWHTIISSAVEEIIRRAQHNASCASFYVLKYCSLYATMDKWTTFSNFCRSPGKIISITVPTFEALTQFGIATITTKNIGEVEASYSLTVPLLKLYLAYVLILECF